jgi:hypothetical protein
MQQDQNADQVHSNYRQALPQAPGTQAQLHNAGALRKAATGVGVGTCLRSRLNWRLDFFSRGTAPLALLSSLVGVSRTGGGRRKAALTGATARATSSSGVGGGGGEESAAVGQGSGRTSAGAVAAMVAACVAAARGE